MGDKMSKLDEILNSPWKADNIPNKFLKQQLKALFLELVGKDKKVNDRINQTNDEGAFIIEPVEACNMALDELRKKVKAL